MKFRKIISVILIAVMLFSMQSFATHISAAEADTNSVNGDIVVKNSNLQFSITDGGSFALINTSSGQIAYSRSAFAENDNYSSNLAKQLMRNEIAIDYYSSQDALLSDTSTTAYGNEAKVEVQNKNGDIKVNYNFEDLKINFNVNYSLKANYLEATVDFKSLKELGDFAVRKITLLPAFFAGTADDNGYIFVPDGSGALINFNNNSETNYNALVYGEEISLDINMKKSYGTDIKMPIFGMVKNGSGAFAIITSGDAVAEISATSKNNENYYNYVYSTVNLRATYLKKMFTKKDSANSSAYKKISQFNDLRNYTVRYYMIDKEANYVKMANIYREYLKEEKGLKKQETSSDINIELVGAIDVKANFLGFTYYKTVPLTSYNAALKLLERFKEAGVDKVSLKYTGWNNDGLTNSKVIKKLSLINELGGRNEFQKLNSYAKENNFNIDYDVEMLKFYKGGKKYKVSTPFNEQVVFNRYMRSVYAKDIEKRSWFLLTPKLIEKNYNKISKYIKKLDIENVSFDTLSNTIYSDFNNKDVDTRNEMQKAVISVFANEKNNYLISGTNANAYTWAYLSKIYSAPAYSSDYNIFDEEIPFYQIVLHGMVNMTGESQFISDNRYVNFLRAVEAGVQLLYTGMAEPTSKIVDTDYDYLYGTNFDLWFDDAVEKYVKYQPLLEKIHKSQIVSHNKLQNDVYETVYDNGVSVIVNYNDYHVSVDGKEIKGYDFCERTVR